MFQGEEIRRLDEKCRVVIPPKFRLFLSDADQIGFFLTVVPMSEERCVRAYTPAEWKRITRDLKELAARSQGPDSFTRVFSSHSEFADLDKQHRVLVSQRLIEYAHLQKKSDLVMVGCTNHIQIWNVRQWRRTVEEDKKSIEGLKGSIQGIFGGFGGSPL